MQRADWRELHAGVTPLDIFNGKMCSLFDKNSRFNDTFSSRVIFAIFG